MNNSVDRSFPCPCGSEATYANCCKPLHQGKNKAQHAEQLMRSRYTAYKLGLEDYIIATHHASTQPKNLLNNLKEQALISWHTLEIVSHQNLINNDEAFVEFKAVFSEADQPGLLHEKSHFVREKNLWFYVDGSHFETPFLLPGRNENCWCGSRRKFKKCHGSLP